jgi:hypothetical protein
MRRLALILLLAATAAVHAQTVVYLPDNPTLQPINSNVIPVDPKHGIEDVAEAPVDGSVATPLPQEMSRRLKKYDIQELTGSRQALGPQLINGRLPKPQLDLILVNSTILQRVSLFEGDLIVVQLTGAGGTILKKVLIPADAAKAYRAAASPDAIQKTIPDALPRPRDGRRGTLLVYTKDGIIERSFDPAGTLPKTFHDTILPLQDLMRAISEDRTVTNTVANYEPRVGDELVGEDRRVYRVTRVVPRSDVVELRCTTLPTVMFVSKQDLYHYFVGSKPTQKSELPRR